MTRRIVFASGNAHKLQRGRRNLRAPWHRSLSAPQHYGGLPDVIEDKTPLAGNAIKAVSACEHTGDWALADDSGIEARALDGAPVSTALATLDQMRRRQ